MDPVTNELRLLLEREKIRDCIARLARGEDRRDAGLIRASYWPDSTTDYGVFAGGFDEYLAWVVPGSPAIPATQHFLGQSVIELDRDTARIETQVISYRSEEHTSELQSLMRISYAVFCLTKKKRQHKPFAQ